jgi:hypothetical protein
MGRFPRVSPGAKFMPPRRGVVGALAFKFPTLNAKNAFRMGHPALVAANDGKWSYRAARRVTISAILITSA